MASPANAVTINRLMEALLRKEVEVCMRLSQKSEEVMSNSLESASRWTGVVFLGTIMFVLFALTGQAHAQCSNPPNPIVAENCQTGNDSSEWDVKTADGGDPTIQGFATDISVNRGSTVFFKINTPAHELYDQHLPRGLLRRVRRA